jgi:hypothetical protein
VFHAHATFQPPDVGDLFALQDLRAVMSRLQAWAYRCDRTSSVSGWRTASADGW